MTTKRRTFDEIIETLYGKFALNDYGRVRFYNEIHMMVRLRTLELCFGECAHTRENQVIANRFYFDTVSERIEVSYNFLEVRGGQIDDG